jgi:twitching motility two-component system response regulator PilG
MFTCRVGGAPVIVKARQGAVDNGAHDSCSSLRRDDRTCKGANQGDRWGNRGDRSTQGSMTIPAAPASRRRETGPIKVRRSVVGANGCEARITVNSAAMRLAEARRAALRVRLCHKVTPADRFCAKTDGYNTVQEGWLEGSLTGMKVMVIDDSTTIRRSAELFLSQAGCEVILAEDGFAALAKIGDHRPDLILVDIMMPRLDGYQACMLIKRNPKFGSTPVVMLSSKDGLFDRARGRMAGSDEYITKPFTKEGLVKAVMSYARKRQ